MSRNVWHKRYHGDAIQGYMGLTLEERGAYTTVLDLLYSSDWSEGIPDRPRWIAGHLNCSVRKWESLRASLVNQGKIFVTSDGLISNSRYVSERKNALETSRANAKNGSSGGRKSGEIRVKSLEDKEPNEATASENRSHTRAKDTEADTEEIKTTSSSQRAKRGMRLKEDWIPKRPYPESVQALVDQWPEGREWREFEQFRDYWTSRTRDAAKSDWDKAWHNRIRDQHDRIIAQTRVEQRNGNNRAKDGAIAALDRKMGLDRPGEPRMHDARPSAPDSQRALTGPRSLF